MGRFEGLQGERDIFGFTFLQSLLLLRLSTRDMRYDAIEGGISHGRAPALQSRSHLRARSAGILRARSAGVSHSPESWNRSPLTA